MYKIEATIRPDRLDTIKASLSKLDVHNISSIECRGIGMEPSTSHTFRGSHYSNYYDAGIRIDCIVTDPQLRDAVAAIQRETTLGDIGDGTILVFEIHDVIRNLSREPAISSRS